MIIKQIGDYYILCPLDTATGQPKTDIETCYRINKTNTDRTISVNNFMTSHKNIYNYAEQKKQFIIKWERYSISNMEISICDFDIDFQQRFLEECIAYVFNMWTSQTQKKSPHHNFYIKMLIFYGIRGIIIWANTAKESVAKKYKSFIQSQTAAQKQIKQQSKTQKHDDVKSEMHDIFDNEHAINLLKSSLANSDIRWIPTKLQQYYLDMLEKTLLLYQGNIKKTNNLKEIKPTADILPIGHLFSRIARFYMPFDHEKTEPKTESKIKHTVNNEEDNEEWTSIPDYFDSKHKWNENNIIIGYDEKPNLSFNVKFKIRQPLPSKKMRAITSDNRTIKKGMTCNSHSKAELQKLCNILKIDISNSEQIEESTKTTTSGLCKLIRDKLISNELNERMKKSNIKWYYFYYENQPTYYLSD